MLQIQWAGEQLTLLPDRAVWWERRGTLLIADPHFGKAAAFRSGGIPVPPGTTALNLGRLSALLDRTGACRLVVLGDFFHAKAGVVQPLVEQLAAWRHQHGRVAVQVVRGNHDRHAGDPPAALDITAVDEGFELDGLTMCHEPCERAGAFVMAGHVHPAVRLHGVGRFSMSVPCFHFAPRTATLPAFGAFTGTHPIRPCVGDRVFAVGEDEVIEVTTIPPPEPSPPEASSHRPARRC